MTLLLNRYVLPKVDEELVWTCMAAVRFILSRRFLRKIQIAHIPSLGETHVQVRFEETPIELTCFTEKLEDRQEISSLQRRRLSLYPRSQLASDDREATKIKREQFRSFGSLSTGPLQTRGPLSCYPTELRDATTHSRVSETDYNFLALQTSQAAKSTTGA